MALAALAAIGAWLPVTLPADALAMCPSSWTGTTTAARTPPGSMALTGVDYAGATVWAVGSEQANAFDASTAVPLIERWTGDAWQRVTAPPSASSFRRLVDVAGADSGDAWAVGEQTGGPLALHWNGTTWSEATVPAPAAASRLAGVAVVGPHVVAVGNSAAGPFIATSDGGAWTSTLIPAPPASSVLAVDAASASNVWVSGWSDVNGVRRGIVLQWDGASWTTHHHSSATFLRDIAVVGSEIWTVGTRQDPSGSTAYASRRSTTSWTELSIPMPASTSRGTLTGVAANDASDVWMVGRVGPSTMDTDSFAVHWDGASLVIAPTPVHGTSYGGLDAVAVAPSSPVWAVGADELSSRADWRCGPPVHPPAGGGGGGGGGGTTSTSASTTSTVLRPEGTAVLPLDAIGSVHADAIAAVIEAGIATGFPDGMYRPDEIVSRAQMATFLVRAFDVPMGGTVPPDAVGSVHAPAIAAVMTAGLATGAADGTYGPQNPVLRGQMAAFLTRALGLTSTGVIPTDAEGSVHAAAIAAVIEAGIASGYSDGAFRPNDPVSRGQMASFLARALALL